MTFTFLLLEPSRGQEGWKIKPEAPKNSGLQAVNHYKPGFKTAPNRRKSAT
jgi:hypothetical protein